MNAARFVDPERCFGAIIDVQDFFLAQADKRERPKIKANIRNFARLLGFFKIPVVVTLERPVEHKGTLPKDIRKHLNGPNETFEKDFFDLSRERRIADHVGRLKRPQALLAGCETDVCVLQSCLGLIGQGYEVFVVEDLLFSSSADVGAAIARMQNAGAVFLTYKTLYFELVAAVEGGRHADRMLKTFGPFPDDLPEFAEQ